MTSKDEFEVPIERKTFYCSRIFENPLSFTTWKGLPSVVSVLRWKFNFDGEEDHSSVTPIHTLNDEDPIIEPKLEQYEKPNHELFSTWLGHASVLTHIDGLNIITDPVFSMHASPIAFGCPRYRDPPCKASALKNIHVGVISHNHYDHLDQAAVTEITKNNPDIKWFVPLGLGSTIAGFVSNVYNNNIYELNWGKEHDFQHEGKTFKILCTPAQHWSQRSAFDRNKTLWSGWAIMGPKHKFFYSGDTGYCAEEFKKLGRKYGPFDLAAIPIGCYLPRAFMQSQHINPEEAVDIGNFVKAKYTMGIHWGTYNMGSNEGILEPRDEFNAAGQKSTETKAFTIKQGETWVMDETLSSENSSSP